jgi:hypothetical protein
MVKFIGAEVTAAVPPPYRPPGVPGFVTVTGTVPEYMNAAAGIVVASLVALTQVVAWATPLKLMPAFVAKLVPSTSKGTAEPPATAPFGTNWPMTGVVPGFVGIVDEEYPHPTNIVESNNTKKSLIKILLGEWLEKV